MFMSENRGFYVTTAIPYVNAPPHLGHALELVQADVLARHRRLRGQPVRFLTGTDDNALKNVTAAAAAGTDVTSFVAANAQRFADLEQILDLSFDDFIRTSSDPRHLPGVERLWHRSAARGDFYQRSYAGLYCQGCEQFYDPADLPTGLCPEHGVAPEAVAEENWFFRLSAYGGQVLEALESGRVRIQPATRRNEVLAFVRKGLEDLSVSRAAARAAGWGIPVPGDPDQTVYVWWDALSNYVTALGYASDQPTHRSWWIDSAERVHVIGKGILRFHAVYWLALLLSAGQPLPTAIFVHDYLTVNGAKLSKSAGNAVDPCDVVSRFGVDALRWWLLREVALSADTDFTTERLVSRYHQDLANGLGNLVNRTLSLVHKYRRGAMLDRLSAAGEGGALLQRCADLPERVDRALRDFDFRAATEAIWTVVDAANALVSNERPWALAKADQAGDSGSAERLDAILATLVIVCRHLAKELTPFIPTGAARIASQLGEGQTVGAPTPAFPRLERATTEAKET
jgi:methionyl-tRNA synthetase